LAGFAHYDGHRLVTAADLLEERDALPLLEVRGEPRGDEGDVDHHLIEEPAGLHHGMGKMEFVVPEAFKDIGESPKDALIVIDDQNTEESRFVRRRDVHVYDGCSWWDSMGSGCDAMRGHALILERQTHGLMGTTVLALQRPGRTSSASCRSTSSFPRRMTFAASRPSNCRVSWMD
jgi:hypothetical protein